MHNLLPTLERWLKEGKRVALATVVKVYGSAPQPIGAKMLVSDRGEMAGSVSGGCVEGAVVQEAFAVLRREQPRLLAFGISDEEAWEVGLACGGTIQVFVEPWQQNDPLFQTWYRALQEKRSIAIATLLNESAPGRKLLLAADGTTVGSLGHPALDALARDVFQSALAKQHPERLRWPYEGGEADIFIDVFPPPPKLIVVGAVHIAIPLVTFARELGFRTYVVDARTAFATRDRFPHADELIIGWPEDVLPRIGLDESTFVVVLSHDEKMDNPALRVALSHPVRYVGALGSRKTHARRVEALRSMGVSEEDLARIYTPIGLNIGARRPEEIAVAIMAEIVAVQNGRRKRT